MVQKAKKVQTSVDRLRKLGDHKNTLYAMNRFVKSPITSGSTTLGNFSGSAGGSTAAAGNYLQTQGDTMVGPIAFYPATVSINASDELDISPGLTNIPQSSSYVIASFGSPDTLQLIKGAQFAGQQLWLQVPASSVLTLEDYSNNAGGNIVTSDGTDIVITTTNDPVTLTLIFDITLSPNANTGGWVVLNAKAITGGTATASFPLQYPTNDQGTKGSSATINHSLSATSGHKLKVTLDGDVTINFTNIPASGTAMDWLVEVTQDNVGGHTITWGSAGAFAPTLSLSETADTTSLVAFHTDDNGSTIRVITLLNAVGSIGDNLGNHTATQDLEMSTHEINFNNDIIALSWANIAADGFLQLKVSDTDFFDFTESNNGPVSLKIRAQHAADPDNTLTITQLSGSTGVGQFFSPNQMQFLGSGSADVFNYDQNRIETNVNILPDDDGTLNIGSASSLRYLAMYAAGFKFDVNRGYNLSTGGGSIVVNGASDTFTITVDSMQKQSMSASLTTLSGNVDILGVVGAGDKVEFAEITAPGADPDPNFGWMYGKLVSGHTEPFWEDEDGTVTNLIGGAGGSVQSISQGNTDVTVADVGAGTIIGTVDGTQNFSVSNTVFGIDTSVTLGTLGSQDIIFNASMASTLDVKTDGSFDIGDATHALNDVFSETLTLRGSGGSTSTTTRYITADGSNMNFHTVSGDGFKFQSAGGTVTEIFSGGGLNPHGDVDFDFGETVDFNENQSGVGSAGFADDLPSKPTGYIVVKVNNTDKLIPFYDT